MVAESLTVLIEQLALAEQLAERVRIVRDCGVRRTGEFVLYWMATAMRWEENPALEVARAAAHELRIPLLVYQGLSQRYPYASDRHHTFILQGARDLQASASDAGLTYALHLERPGADEPRLRQLVQRAALVVIEEMPTGPTVRMSKAVAKRDVSMLAVDTACVVPMQMVGQAYDRAFEYRSATKRMYRQRVGAKWEVESRTAEPLDLQRVGFAAIDLRNQSIAEWVGECEIDHTVGPVVDTIGGSVAGYARWQAFVMNGIRKYAVKRNNALLTDGVSRMSAYLHYGMVSPFRLARESYGLKHEGAEKFLDELLIWRELAYSFCFYRPDHGRWSALPDWARETLNQHARDIREAIHSWETLARGKTGDDLWNAAQASLLIHGELHNNVRMTWGKAILQWTKSPREALKRIVDLNHRYALDGRDPASYGGILWCLGQFDRPFSPEQPVLGTVRGRSTDEHAKRLDPRTYAKLTTTSRCYQPPRVAVIGAGIGGTIAARTLADHGLAVTIFEKSRGAGGRMSTRRTEEGQFDHGAQYFTARDETFRRYVHSWCDDGIVKPWQGNVAVYREGKFAGYSRAERWVATPAMNSLAKHLGQHLEVVCNQRVSKLEKIGKVWRLINAESESLGEFERVVFALPAPQIAEILVGSGQDELVGKLKEVEYDPCWCLMMRLREPLACDWSGAFVNQEVVSWVARNGSKRSVRDDHSECLTVHATGNWSKENFDCEPAVVGKEIANALWSGLGIAAGNIAESLVHRWKYSIPRSAIGERFLANGDQSCIACGDWAGGPKVEGAFLSGAAAAGVILRSLSFQAGSISARQRSLFD